MRPAMDTVTASAPSVWPWRHSVKLALLPPALPSAWKRMRRRPVVLVARFDAATVLDLVESEHVTNCSLAPTMISMLLDHADDAAERLSSLRQISYGASAMPLDLMRSLSITSAGFGMEAEITGKLLARGIRPFEVPITYRARSREAGKKITWRDGVEALWILGRIRLSTWVPAAPRRAKRLVR